ncbi:MAG: extracellular solute-binding protein [Lachnospiraceae bacterium]|nr:extracellular solute-binding protein [Lachnospiraceae bacterium]
MSKKNISKHHFIILSFLLIGVLLFLPACGSSNADEGKLSAIEENTLGSGASSFKDSFSENTSAENGSEETSTSESIAAKTNTDGKTVLTLGMLLPEDFPELLTAVAEFNQANEDFQVEVIDYYGEGSYYGYDEAALQLSLDIVLGKAPDIFFTGMIDYEALAGLGVFADLYELMEQDEDFDKEMLLTNILEPYEINGKLYSIAPAFRITSLWGGSSLVQGRYGVSMDELVQILEENGGNINSIYGLMSDEPILTTLCTLYMDSFIDWDNGTCDFENEEFYQLLEFAQEYNYTGGYGAEGQKASINSGEELLSYGIISCVADYQIQCELYGEAVEVIGLPTTAGSGTTAYFSGVELGINAAGEHQEAAWEFVKYYIFNGYSGSGFSIVQEIFDEVMAEAMEDNVVNSADSGINEIMWKASYDSTIFVYKASQEDVDAVRAMIARVDGKHRYHTDIQTIITEEADSYFSGQKSREDVAALIQNRVSLYLAEQGE